MRAYIGLGANLGDAARQLDEAVLGLAAWPGVQVLAVSSRHVSAPVDASGPDYLNAVAAIATELTPLALLACLQTLEARAGRARSYRNAPRTLDLDLLMFGDVQMQTTELTLPHPRMHERAFVLLPLAELAPALHVPGHGALQALLPAVADQRLARQTP